MNNNFFITRLLISSIGILITVFIFPLMSLGERYYEMMELLDIDDNIFASVGLFLTLIVFFFFLKNGDKYFSAILFSIFYYFFVPFGLIQLLYYDTTDGQIAFVIFPTFIIFSIILFFVLILFNIKKN